MVNKETLSWDGEKIKYTLEVPESKFSPKEMIEALQSARAQEYQKKEALMKNKSSKAALEYDLKSLQEFIEKRAPFEEKCMGLQHERLQKILAEIIPSCREQAEKESQMAYDKDPSAYSDNQIANQRYALFQKKLATHEKVAKKIAKRIWSKDIYEEPIYEDPWKKKD